MRLTCPSCGASYEVPDSVFPEAGREVECSACSTRWFQHRVPPEAPLSLGPQDAAPRGSTGSGPAENDRLADTPPAPQVQPRLDLSWQPTQDTAQPERPAAKAEKNDRMFPVEPKATAPFASPESDEAWLSSLSFAEFEEDDEAEGTFDDDTFGRDFGATDQPAPPPVRDIHANPVPRSALRGPAAPDRADMGDQKKDLDAWAPPSPGEDIAARQKAAAEATPEPAPLPAAGKPAQPTSARPRDIPAPLATPAATASRPPATGERQEPMFSHAVAPPPPPGTAPSAFPAPGARKNLQRRDLEQDVLDILREEAAFEAKARNRGAGPDHPEPVHHATDYSAGSAPVTAPRPQETHASPSRQETVPRESDFLEDGAFLDEGVPSRDDGLLDGQPRRQPRRSGLIEDEDDEPVDTSWLDAIQTEEDEDDHRGLVPDASEFSAGFSRRDRKRERPVTQGQRAGYYLGLLLPLIVVVVLIVLYFQAPTLARSSPGMASWLMGYVDLVDSIRLGLAKLWAGLIGWIGSMF